MSESNESSGENALRQPAVPQADGVIHQTHFEAAWRGPLPPPGIIRQYEEITPGAGDRILSLAERQMEHSHRMESTAIGIQQTVVIGDSRRSSVGLWLGFVIAVMGIIAGTYLAATGHEWPGVVIAGVPLSGLVGVFIYGSKTRRDERSRYAENTAEQQSPPGG